jgi:hypothetical protein
MLLSSDGFKLVALLRTWVSLDAQQSRQQQEDNEVCFVDHGLSLVMVLQPAGRQ